MRRTEEEDRVRVQRWWTEDLDRGGVQRRRTEA